MLTNYFFNLIILIVNNRNAIIIVNIIIITIIVTSRLVSAQGDLLYLLSFSQTNRKFLIVLKSREASRKPRGSEKLSAGMTSANCPVGKTANS